MTRKEELDRMLQESFRKQQITNRIGLAAAIGSVICSIALIVYQIIH